MNKKTLSVRSLDDAARLSDGYVKQSLPTPDLERDRLISEAIAKRKNKRIEEVRF